LMDMLSGPKESPEEAPKDIEAEAVSSADTVGSIAAIFDRMPDLFQPDAAAGVDVVFQFNITGTGGGDWIVIVKDGVCTIEDGQHGNPVTTLKMESGDFIDLFEGSLPAMQAYTSGKLKIEGDLMKSQLVQKLFKFG
jgi:putative sterol carrier protein